MSPKRVCLLNGQHTPGSAWALECPLNPNRVADRQALRAQRRREASPAQQAARRAAARRFASYKSAGRGRDL